ncbi:MAG TPA: BON domain-containing protein [Vicinamibacterales bacterium]|nr:BON domain-containing protein [Vicinamibacterales bacterium]
MRSRGVKFNKPDVLDDDELQRLITERIDEDAAFWSGGARRRTYIVVEVEEGLVTLTGVVRTALDRRRADILARALGAVGVDNRLRVLEGAERDSGNRKSA